MNHVQNWGKELKQQNLKRCISLFATKKTLATPLLLPLALFRRISNFSFYKVADSIF